MKYKHGNNMIIMTLLTQNNVNHFISASSLTFDDQNNPNHVISLTFLNFDRKINPTYYICLSFLTFNNNEFFKPLSFVEFPNFLYPKQPKPLYVFEFAKF